MQNVNLASCLGYYRLISCIERPLLAKTGQNILETKENYENAPVT